LVSNFSDNSYPLQEVALTHCQLRGVYQAFRTFASGCNVALTNTVLEASSLIFEQGYTGCYTFAGYGLWLYNDLLRRGSVTFKSGTGGSAWTVKDNLFDSDTLTISGTYNLTAGYNGYRSGLSSLGGSGNKTGLTMDYVTGPAANWHGVLGSFYYPASGGASSLTNLVNTGSRLASSGQLYHFTTQTATNTVEGSTQVDIGAHWVGVAWDNLPLDTDGDTLPDYFEDRNGNGTFDSGETDWTSYNSPNGLTGTPALEVFTPLK
jgi:hypothetical protein